ncbi:MFS transporter, partial [Rhizobium ruizarguesonis]
GPSLIASGNSGHDAVVIIGFGVRGLSFCQATGSISSRFGRVYRYTGAAFTSDLAWLIGAGFAPLVALSLSILFGLTF